MEKRIASFITYLFHPLLIPTYGMCIIYQFFSGLYFIHDWRVPLLILGITFVSTCLLPALSTVLLFKSGFIKSPELSDRKERLLPYLITSLYYSFAFYLFDRFPIPSGMLHIIRLFILGAAGSILLTALITLFWKISAHTIAIGGLAGALLGLNFILPVSSFGVFYAALLCAGVAGYSRLKLNAHTPAQVYVGFILGFASMFGLISFL